MCALPCSLSSKKVLVTGASGFIGRSLCQRLCHHQAQVFGVSRFPQESTGAVRWMQADVTSLEEMQRIIAQVKPDILFHLAADSSASRSLEAVRSTLQGNLVSTVNLLTLMAEMGGRVVLAGSLEEPDQGEFPIASSPYAAAKWASSVYAQMFQELYQLSIVRARLFMVYGPGQMNFKKLIPYVTSALLNGEAPQLSSGQRLIDWIYIDDVVDGLIAAAQSSEDGLFEFGSGTLTSITEVVHQLNRMINPSIQPMFGALSDRPMEQVRVANLAASMSKLNWRPKVSLEEGLARTVEWYRHYHQATLRSCA
ncbi:NAD-dependent epimerase/dehydratase family protein [Leptolyngbya sp. AN03gr2]|uniref:NAD-dependent epimerase/dehydratase family protein n=1 Tax=unclassified Leptolyngbya TaxID=2650499 RepID=UPI003D30F43E